MSRKLFWHFRRTDGRRATETERSHAERMMALHFDPDAGGRTPPSPGGFGPGGRDLGWGSGGDFEPILPPASETVTRGKYVREERASEICGPAPRMLDDDYGSGRRRAPNAVLSPPISSTTGIQGLAGIGRTGTRIVLPRAASVSESGDGTWSRVRGGTASIFVHAPAPRHGAQTESARMAAVQHRDLLRTCLLWQRIVMCRAL